MVDENKRISKNTGSLNKTLFSIVFHGLDFLPQNSQRDVLKGAEAKTRPLETLTYADFKVL